MKRFLKIMSLVLVVALGVFALVACGDNSTEAKKADDEAGFNEIEIFDGEKVGFLSCGAVYFQAVSMNDGNTAEDYDCHLELDIAALENNYGYGVGDWVPYLTVGYIITKDGSTWTNSGTFMPMSADDGPHYGANVKMDGAGAYKVSFTISFPSTSTYLLHIDEETGPGAKAFPDTYTISAKDWNFAPVVA
ncbi:MAG: iron transporter [Clostridia bacterium]|nr:iron transporter [Clostridia bacterium]